MFFITSIIIFITLLNTIVYFLRKHHEEDNGERSNLGESSCGQSCRRFSLSEIKLATQNFDEGLVLGKGGFGKVYKGIIDNGKTTVAIKRLGYLSKQGATEFWTEIQMLSKFRHSHLVSLIGYCNDQQEMLIVYEYMPGGTLDDNLHKIDRNLPLFWIQRLKICIGGARGLDYLHTGTDIQTRVIHRDVKSSNILLNENLDAKISDFGLSVTGPANQQCTHVSTHVKGTFGYLDPEYFLTRRLTRKSDVYAFGVVLFEVLSGRPAVDVRLEEEQWGLALWVKHCLKEGKIDEIVDPSLRGNILPDCLKVFSETAEQCLQNNSKRRPTMAEVVTKLEFALALQERTHHSTEDAEIISNGGDYGNQENADSSTEMESSNAATGGDFPMEEGNNDEIFETNGEQINGIMQVHGGSLVISHPKPAKNLTFLKKVQLFFATKPDIITGGEYSKVNQEFSLHELIAATDNFSSNRIVGRGGSGTVYKGRLADGSEVAIKRLKQEFGGGKFYNPRLVENIFLISHPNLIRLLGVCLTPTEKLLVYPYMPNGSLASCLKLGRAESHTALDWPRRKQIALGSARGLAYLHDDCNPKIIHRDVKAGNILLNEDFEAVVADFGLAQLMDCYDTHVTTNVCGTIGFIAPEYLSTGKCSLKTDVFGYGVMLLELISARRIFDLSIVANHDDSNLIEWVRKLVKVKNFGPLVGGEFAKEIEPLIQVAVLCTQDSPVERPKMSEVVKMLDKNGEYSKFNEGFSLHELIAATDNFSSNRIVGRGGSGTVYKGQLADGSEVAIKRLKQEFNGGKLCTPRYIVNIFMTSHPNLLRLLGFCMTPAEKLLVYPYMPNGSLASCLKLGRAESHTALDWPRRKQIALGSARGLAYLHDDCNPKIIHRDVKAGNILLNEDFEAVVADFGLVKLMDCDDTHVTTNVRGTIGFIAPEYLSTGKCSLKTDVFGYGAMLLELISGRRIFDLISLANDDNLNVVEWVRNLAMDKNFGLLVGGEIAEEIEPLIQVAVLCTQDSPVKRPKMSEVVKMLEDNERLSERWEEYLQNEEMLQQEFSYNSQRANISWIEADSIDGLSNEELSGPR